MMRLSSVGVEPFSLLRRLHKIEMLFEQSNLYVRSLEKHSSGQELKEEVNLYSSTSPYRINISISSSTIISFLSVKLLSYGQATCSAFLFNKASCICFTY
jgi:hypothetical protein